MTKIKYFLLLVLSCFLFACEQEPEQTIEPDDDEGQSSVYIMFRDFLSGGDYYDVLPTEDIWIIEEDEFLTKDTTALHGALRRVKAEDSSRRITLDFSKSTFSTIESYCMYDFSGDELTALEEIIFPTTLTATGDRVVRNLANLLFVSGLDNVVDFSSTSFRDCANLYSLELPKVTTLATNSLKGTTIKELKLTTNDKIESLATSLSTSGCMLIISPTNYAEASDKSWAGYTWAAVFKDGEYALEGNEVLCFDDFLEGGRYYTVLPEQDYWFIVESDFANADSASFHSALRRVNQADENRRITADFSYSTFTTISDYTIYDVTGGTSLPALGGLIMPTTLTSIGTRVFRNLSNLTILEGLDNLESADDYTFYALSSLTEIYLPKLSFLHTLCLNNCGSLTKITLGTEAEDKLSTDYTNFTGSYTSNVDLWVSEDVFNDPEYVNMQYCTLTVPTSSSNSTTGYVTKEFKTINGKSKTDYQYDLPGGAETLYFAYFKEGGKYYDEMPESDYWYICESTFALTDTVGLHRALRKVSLEQPERRLTLDFSYSTFTSVSAYCLFDNTATKYDYPALKALVFPSTLTSIESRVIRNLSNLESVTGLENVTSLGEYVLYGCSSLNSLYLPKLTQIRNFDFTKAPLTSLTLGTAVETPIYYFASDPKLDYLFSGVTTTSCDLTVSEAVYNNSTYVDKATNTLKIPYPSVDSPTGFFEFVFKSINETGSGDTSLSVTVGDSSITDMD